MRRTALIIVMALTGCSGGLVGQWEGTCTTRVGNDLVDYDIELDITDVAKGDLDGTAEVVDVDAENTVRSGDLSGTEDGHDIDVEIGLPEGSFNLSGEVKGSTLSGDCEWQATKGDFELDKVE